MQLDWFTVVAQILNFLILVALLKRFLYAPILRAMDEREQHITTRLHEAQEHTDMAERQAARYTEQLQELHSTRDTLLAQTRAEAEDQRRNLMEQARTEVQHLRVRWHEALDHEQASFLYALRHQAGIQVCAAARRALTDLADVDLEQRVIATFLRRLRALPDDARDTLAKAAQAESSGVVIASAFAVPEDLRRHITETVQTHVTDDPAVAFVVKPELICGIELEVCGTRLAWTLAEYLDHLAEHFAAILSSEISAVKAHTS